MHAWGVAGQHHAEGLRARIEADRMAGVLPVPRIEHREVQSTREPAQHRAHLAHDPGDPLHVPADEGVRHSGGGRELQDVVVRRLIGIPERQRGVQKMVRGFRAHGDQAVEGNTRQRLARRLLALGQEVAADEPSVRLADLDERLARPVVQDGDHVQTGVRDAVAEDR